MCMGVIGPLHATCMHMAYTAVITSILFLASIATVGAAPAAASNPDVIVEHVTDLGVFKGRHYVQVEGLIVATFPRPGEVAPGSYCVPLIMAFPVQHEDDGDDEGKAGNRVGLVDVPNSADFNILADRPLTEENITQWALRATGDYLFREGYTYLAVQWNKTVTDRLGANPPPGRPRRLGYGVIERATDSTQILRDASSLLRHPVALGDLGTPEAVEHVLAFGYSQTAFIVGQFINTGSNQDAGGLFYDGFALSVDIRANIVPPSPFPADQGKIIALYTETDLQFFRAALNRPSRELDYYRHYELAGVAHLPKPLMPLDADPFGATRQNPATLAPAQRAVIDNLVAWIRHGDEPPPSKFIDGTLLPDGTFMPERDADGNALGGLRLPHMPSVLCDDHSRDADDCRAAGAPLGTYTGLETDNVPVPPNTNLYVMWGGTFEPFSPAELKARYRNRGTYIRLVRRAAQALRQQGYILPEDYRRYVREAAHQPL
jgi:Alpha/beta hydrolase domain